MNVVYTDSKHCLPCVFMKSLRIITNSVSLRSFLASFNSLFWLHRLQIDCMDPFYSSHQSHLEQTSSDKPTAHYLSYNKQQTDKVNDEVLKKVKDSDLVEDSKHWT